MRNPIIKYIEFLMYLLFCIRYYLRKKRLLNKFRLVSKKEVEQYQFKKLKEIFEYSYENVPYYNELFNKNNFHPDNFKSLEDIKKIPYLTKNIIKNNQEKLISRVFPKKYLKIEHTGGTTGLPMDFVLDKRTSSPYEMAFLEKMWKRIGYNLFDRTIVLRQDTVEKIIEGRKYWKMKYPQNWLIMSAFHLNIDTFHVFYKKILSFKPKFIIAFPSNAYLLAKLIKMNNLKNIPTLKAVICSSENMYEWQRKYMEEVYKVRIFSYYGHSEKCVIASECSDSSLYVFNPHYGFTELISKDNNWCSKENERGEIVVTGFNNFASPLIRYKTDDIGVNSTKCCNDNPSWFTIKKIEGRIQDFLVDKDGIPKTYIHIDRPFWDIRDKLYAYQYIQNTPGKVLLNIHTKEKLGSKEIEDIKKDFLKVYLKFEIEVKQVKYIPRTKSGKFRYLVQNIKNIT